jgi:hypothetical protein
MTVAQSNSTERRFWEVVKVGRVPFGGGVGSGDDVLLWAADAGHVRLMLVLIRNVAGREGT